MDASDRSLTPVAGMAAVTELAERLDVVAAVDTAVGPIKHRDLGHTAGQLLARIAATQLAGEEPSVQRHSGTWSGTGPASSPPPSTLCLPTPESTSWRSLPAARANAYPERFVLTARTELTHPPDADLRQTALRR